MEQRRVEKEEKDVREKEEEEWRVRKERERQARQLMWADRERSVFIIVYYCLQFRMSEYGTGQ